MCGIAGLYNEGLSSDECLLYLQKMGNFLHHRGPDDSGIWKDENSSLGLVHTRLSIQDLSKNGSQPMLSTDGRYLICFNGEIYNHLDLRKNIEKNTKHIVFTKTHICGQTSRYAHAPRRLRSGDTPKL